MGNIIVCVMRADICIKLQSKLNFMQPADTLYEENILRNNLESIRTLYLTCIVDCYCDTFLIGDIEASIVHL